MVCRFCFLLASIPVGRCREANHYQCAHCNNSGSFHPRKMNIFFQTRLWEIQMKAQSNECLKVEFQSLWCTFDCGVLPGTLQVVLYPMYSQPCPTCPCRRPRFSPEFWPPLTVWHWKITYPLWALRNWGGYTRKWLRAHLYQTHSWVRWYL